MANKCIKCKQEFETPEAKEQHQRENIEHGAYEDRVLKLTAKLFLKAFDKSEA